jgi:MFS family permease
VTAPTSRPRRPGLRTALAGRGGLARHHDFRQLWIGDTVSQLGTQVSLLALPVLAVRELGATELQMGLLAASETLAFLVIGLPAGAWVDRWRRKRVLVNADLVRALALATLPAAWLFDLLTLAQLYLVALVVGASTVFFDVGYQSYLPSLVPPSRIAEGNAKLQASQSVAMVAGPAVAGTLIRLVGAPLAVLLDAASYLLSALFVGRIRTVDVLPAAADRRPLRTEIAEGVRFVVHQPLLVRITSCTAISNLFSSMTGAMLVLFALRDLGLTEATVGLAFSAGSVGGLLGAVSTTAVTRWVGEGRAIPLTAVGFAAAGFVLPLAGRPLPAPATLVVSSFLLSYFVVVYNVTQVSFRQRLCPPALLGRMNASIRFAVFGTMPLGALLGGVLAEGLGIRTMLWVAAVGGATAALPVLFSPLLGMRTLPAELDVHAEAPPTP